MSPMLAISVPVVRKMLDAVQGSGPNRCSANGDSKQACPQHA